MGLVWLLTERETTEVRVGGRHDIRAAAFRPNAREALVTGNHGVMALAGEDGVREIASPTREALRGVAWRPDGALALAVGDGGAIVAYDGTCTATPTLTPVNLRRCAWHPSGTYCLIAGNDGLALRWQDGRSRAVGWGHHHLRDVAWRPDGAFALIAANGGLYRYEDGGDDLELVAEEPDGDLTGVAWDEAGTNALVAGYRQVGLALADRAAFARLVDAHGVEIVEVVPGRPGEAFVGVARQPGTDAYWIVQQPVYQRVQSSVLRWQQGQLEEVFTSRTMRLGPLAWDSQGGQALICGSPRADFWRM